MQRTPYEILKRVGRLGLVNRKMRLKIVEAILKEVDCVCGIRWVPRHGKYEIWGLNFFEDGVYKEIYNSSIR